MGDADKKPFWDSFDIHAKRWQTVLALVVAVGVIVGFTGSKLGWHWPSGESTQVQTAISDAGLEGWGPERELFTTRKPASYAVLNSITDNPAHGDERNFVQVRLAEQDGSQYRDVVRADAGDIVVVYVYVANDCADNFASSTPSALQGLTAQLENPSTGTDLPFRVILRAKNAGAVWDGASVLSKQPSRLVPVQASALMHTAFSDGFALDDAAFARGETMLLGAERQDGEFPVGRTNTAMEAGAGFLTFRMRVEALRQS